MHMFFNWFEDYSFQTSIFFPVRKTENNVDGESQITKGGVLLMLKFVNRISTKKVTTNL